MPEHAEIINYPTSAGGIITRVVEAGTGPNVVLFIHGLGARADRWRRNLPVLADAGFRCIAIDLPGHGFAHKGPGFAYGVPGYADFVEKFIAEHDLKRLHFVGTSLGAHVLGTVLCRNPSIVRSFTMIGATGMFPIGKESRDNIAERTSDLSREGVRRKLGGVIFDTSLISESMVEEEWRINNSHGAKESFALLADYFRTRLDEDVIGVKLAQLSRGKPLILWGEEDRSVPVAIGRKIEELMGAPLISIPHTAHAPYWEASKAVNDLLLTHLKMAEAS